MDFSICYTKTFTVTLDAEDLDSAIEAWEELDLDLMEDRGASPVLCNVEWVDADGKPHAAFY